MRLLQVEDSTSKADTTIKVQKISYGEDDEEVIIHQIEGSYNIAEDFDREWDSNPPNPGLVNFLSLSLMDTKKLVNALTEEIPLDYTQLSENSAGSQSDSAAGSKEEGR